MALNIKEPVKEYLEKKKIPDLMNEMAEVLMDNRPENVCEHLASWLETSDSQPKSSPPPSAKVGPPKPPGGGPPPPPPPPPPPGFLDDILGKNKNTGEDAGKIAAQRAALFQDIAKGTDITRTLRKVSDSEKRHKNRDKDGVGQVTDFAELERKKAARQEELEKKKQQVKKAANPPKLALEGKQWKIENQAGTRTEKKHDVLSDANMTHAIYLSDCENYFLEVPEKVNMVIISDCKNVDVMLGKDVVSGVELSKAIKVQVQACGKLPSFIIDRCDEISLFTSKDSRDVEITSCASTSVNVTFDDAEGGEDPIEKPVPEQFVTEVVMTENGPKLRTTPMVHAA